MGTLKGKTVAGAITTGQGSLKACCEIVANCEGKKFALELHGLGGLLSSCLFCVITHTIVLERLVVHCSEASYLGAVQMSTLLVIWFGGDISLSKTCA